MIGGLGQAHCALQHCDGVGSALHFQQDVGRVQPIKKIARIQLDRIEDQSVSFLKILALRSKKYRQLFVRRGEGRIELNGGSEATFDFGLVSVSSRAPFMVMAAK